MVFLDFAESKKAGGIIGGIRAKSNLGKNMVGGISGKRTDKGIKSFMNRAAPGDKLAGGAYLSVRVAHRHFYAEPFNTLTKYLYN